jgi:hypothetical protein
MAPIRLGDGTAIDSVRLGDGTGIDEITVGSDVVFSAKPALPSGVISQYKMDEGSGSVISDSTGNEADGTINGASFLSDSNAVGGTKLDFDGSNDDVQLTQPSWVTLNNKVTIAVTVEWDTLPLREQSVYDFGDSGNSIFFSLGIPDNDSNDLGVFIRQGGINQQLSISNLFSINSKTRIAATVDWDSVDTDVSINGNNIAFDGNNSVGATAENALASAGFRSFSDCKLDNFVVYNRVLSQSDIQQDYDAQPWS